MIEARQQPRPSVSATRFSTILLPALGIPEPRLPAIARSLYGDTHLARHSLEVARYARVLASAAHLPHVDQGIAELAAVFHDIGKLALDQTVLAKPRALTADELAIVREHPLIGYRMLLGLELPDALSFAVLEHHEHWDGSGYPDQLRERQISELARILAVADALDSMLSDRPHSPALGAAEAFGRLRDARGTQFDPTLTDLALEVLPCHVPHCSQPSPSSPS